jgi:hypothetical protein
MSRYWSKENEQCTISPEDPHLVSANDRVRWNSKQEQLMFDQTPTLNSNNAITSGAVAEAIKDVLEKLNKSVGDINKSLSSKPSQEYVDSKIGDIDLALDSIIAIQERILGW